MGTLDALYWLPDRELAARLAACGGDAWIVLFRPGDAVPQVEVTADRIGRLAAARYCALSRIRMRDP